MASLYSLKITDIKGVGEKRGKLFAKLGAPTAGDLLRFYPRDYEDWGNYVSISASIIGDVNVIKATVAERPKEHRVKGGMLLYKVTVTDGFTDMVITFFNNRFIPNLLKEGETYLFRGKVTGGFHRREMASPEFLAENKAEDLVPIYPQTEGLSSKLIAKAVKECIKLLPSPMKDPIPEDIRKGNGLCSLEYAINNIHFPESREALHTASSRLIFEELLVLQLGLKRIRRKIKQDNRHPVGSDFSTEFASLLPFEMTGAQKRAVAEAVADMMSPNPMNRLIQGDVGSGKTAVAASLCYTAAKNGLQAALMAPTEILAAQHYQSLHALLEPAGIKVELLTGSVSAKNKKLIYEELNNGSIHLVIGTHALISEAVTFHNLGLVITDEQHRFGVGQRSALAEKGDNPHTLVMSATPIPRTLALMIYGDLDISVLNELPPGRQKIETYCIDSQKRHRAYGYIQKHLDEGRQAYIICPLIEESDSDMASVTEYAERLKEFFPTAAIGLLHGKMKPAEKDRVMEEFSEGKTDILVSTTVVEVGVDVPNAVIMMIENAERYGLSQLHQLRGRVGRGKYKSTCILVTDAQNDEAQSRMKIMCSTSDGFRIADEDLRLRGPGDFFGQRQHGLPRLKIADMMENMDVMTKAQAASEYILANDPDLEQPEHRALRAETLRLFDKNAGLTF